MSQLPILLGVIFLSISALFLSKNNNNISLLENNQRNLLVIPQEVVEKYNLWKNQFKSSQQVNPQINIFRLGIFNENLNLIEKVNKEQSSYFLGQTQFMDLSKEEFIEKYLNPSYDQIQDTYQEKFFQDQIENQMNWTAKGAVNSVPNQGSCQAGWAFTAVAIVEGYQFKKTGILPQLSQQQLIDCATWTYGNFGCNGGEIYPTLRYVISNGLTTLKQYPYTALQKDCQINFGDYKIVSRSNKQGCQNLLDQLQIQPTGVQVDASNWQLYKGGVFNNCGNKLNHGVISTGYDSQKNWVIRNSWGTAWGNNGYMTLSANNSTCGICNSISNAQ